MNFTDFTSDSVKYESAVFVPMSYTYKDGVLIEERTSEKYVREFCTLNKANKTLLCVVAQEGNFALIDHIVKDEGTSLLTVANRHGYAPLHCAILCENPENGYLAAKKLVQLGTPINLVHQFEDVTTGIIIGETPLELALLRGKTKIATMLLRLGGLARLRPEMQATFDAAMMTENEVLFKLGIGLREQLPEDMIKYVLNLSVKLDQENN